MLAQDELLDFSGGGLGQRAEHHLPGHLEMREARAAVLDDVVLRRLRPVLQLDERTRHLAPFGSGLATTAAAITAGCR